MAKYLPFFSPLLVVYLLLTSANPALTVSHSIRQSSTCKNQPQPRPCGTFCSFKLCERNNREIEFLPTAPSVLLLDGRQISDSRFICSTQSNLHSVLDTGEARLFDTNDFIPISRWRPTGLDPPFRSDTFTSQRSVSLRGPGIGRGSDSRGNQWSFLHNRCVILPILRYEERLTDGSFRQRTSAGEVNSCVSFRTIAPALHFRVEWDNSDDFDMLVVAPDGSITDLVNMRTSCGRLLGDMPANACRDGSRNVTEDIVFLPGNVLPGLYTAEVRHSGDCNRRQAARWTLQFIRNGTVVRDAKGVSNNEGAVVANRTIRITERS
eukprot:GFKZ01004467.1.p1 GENE.GFKZ01004467.1~~GFKZ01004467.1.p1  ORF type:complete len:322 (+),score=11.90 GFKZ01004467.1:115-1080(+)